MIIVIAAQFFAVSASAYIPISPLHLFVNTCTSDLSISGSTATCKSTADGYIGVTTKIKIEQYLQISSGGTWENVPYAYWLKTESSHSSTATNYKNNLSNGTYRLRTVFTINDVEVITVISSEKTKS